MKNLFAILRKRLTTENNIVRLPNKAGKDLILATGRSESLDP
jgi:hypothetical protein